MARRNLSAVVRYLRQLTDSASANCASDAELLERYVHNHDESAFELMLWRHGTLVFNVCRRILPCEQDAEDAFQATFLVFVRKASSINRRSSIASWLYKVAYRIALDAKERLKKTAAVANLRGESLTVQSMPDPAWSDVRPILDEELNRLPERLRRPIVLCYLEGKSNAEAARELGCRLGTIYSRLSRGREMLRQCLQRRGVTVPVTTLTMALTACAVEAAATIRLVRMTSAFVDPSVTVVISPRAAALAEGVLRTMFVTKLKIVAVMILVVSIAAGSVLTYARTAAPQAEANAEETVPKPAGESKKDAEPITVKVVKPKQGVAQTMLSELATDVAQRQQLAPLVSGTIKKVAVDVGDRVKKGQVLIELDAPLIVKEVEQAEAALEMSQAQMDDAKAAVAVAEDIWRENTTRSNSAKLQRARASLKAAEANVKLAQVALDRAGIQAELTRLRAEFDGVIAERNCNPGNYVQSGASSATKPLLKLVSVDRLFVTVDLPPELAGIAERGDPVELSVQGVTRRVEIIDGNPGPHHNEPIGLSGDREDFIPAQIAHISPIVDRPYGIRTARIAVDNSSNRLVPGMSIGVQIHFSKMRRFVVPSKCLVRRKHKGFDVYVVRDGKAHPVLISLHKVNHEGAEIVGIKASDVVIANNLGELSDGSPVRIEKGP